MDAHSLGRSFRRSLRRRDGNSPQYSLGHRPLLICCPKSIWSLGSPFSQMKYFPTVIYESWTISLKKPSLTLRMRIFGIQCHWLSCTATAVSVAMSHMVLTNMPLVTSKNDHIVWEVIMPDFQLFRYNRIKAGKQSRIYNLQWCNIAKRQGGFKGESISHYYLKSHWYEVRKRFFYFLHWDILLFIFRHRHLQRLNWNKSTVMISMTWFSFLIFLQQKCKENSINMKFTNLPKACSEQMCNSQIEHCFELRGMQMTDKWLLSKPQSKTLWWKHPNLWKENEKTNYYIYFMEPPHFSIFWYNGWPKKS